MIEKHQKYSCLCIKQNHNTIHVCNFLSVIVIVIMTMNDNDNEIHLFKPNFMYTIDNKYCL